MRTRKVRCRRCKQYYELDGGMPELCPSCTQLKEAWKDKVRMAVWEQPGITAVEVHVKTEVPLAVVMEMIKTGDLLVMPGRGGDVSRPLDALKSMQEKPHIVQDVPLQISEEPEIEKPEIEKPAEDAPPEDHTTLSDEERIKFRIDN